MTGLLQALIIKAVKDCGTSSVGNVMSVIEEGITPKEYQEVEDFLKWAFFDWDKRSFGHGNFRDRWREWGALQRSLAVQETRKVCRYGKRQMSRIKRAEVVSPFEELREQLEKAYREVARGEISLGLNAIDAARKIVRKLNGRK